MAVQIRTLTGTEIAESADALASLRVAVFAEWPYLYDGDAAYERAYLRDFLSAPDAVMVAALDGERIVGAATASPMLAQDEGVRGPLEAIGLDTEALFYFGESILLEEYRGQGLGHAFFDKREAHAKAAGASGAVFAAVIRPDDHPDRPANPRSLEGFWLKRGYRPVEGATMHLRWKDHREPTQSDKPMRYWMRRFTD